jgi:hypothetical protein
VRNRVEGNPMAGILLVSLNEFQPRDNRIEGNVLNDNGIDLLYSPTGTNEGLGNCFVGNDFTSSWPESIEQVMLCDGKPMALGGTPPPSASAPPGVDYRTLSPPPDQLPMPTGLSPTVQGGAGAVPPTVDVAAIKVPGR